MKKYLVYVIESFKVIYIYITYYRSNAQRLHVN